MTSTTIGKFQIQSRLGRGGMADVYRCALRGIGGFEKVVVVKRIRAERASDPEFVGMFLDEARLAANLNHPNIVQVFEIDEVGGAPYIAMEYVRGPTLALLLHRARQAARTSPAVAAGHVCKILAGVCEGLHYAHTAPSPTGEPLGLVHRDVSPQNVIVSREGVPKLLDFGIAKANGRSTATHAGTLKGKLRYIAPEQLTGTIDHRADVFSVGVCLYEATTGQSPYGDAAGNEMALLHSITQARILRPSEVVPDYPPALEEIVLSAMAPDPARRCPSARELHDRLEALVASGPCASSTRAVAAWVAELFPDPDDSGVTPRRTHELPETMAELFTPLPEPAPPRWRPGHRSLAVVASVVVLAGAGLAAWRWSPGPPPRAPLPALEVSAVPATRSLRSSPVPAEAPAVAAEVRSRGQQAREAGVLHRRRGGRPPADSIVAARPAPPEAHLPLEDPRGDEEPVADLVAPSLTATLAEPIRPIVPAVSAATERRPPPAREAITLGAAGRSDAVYSTRPRSSVPRPGLPSVYTAQGSDDLLRMLATVEEETTKAGCSPEFVHGITGAVARALSTQRAPEIFPAAMYYFIVNEAALGREKRTAEQELRKAHGSGIIRALARLPAADGR